MGRARESAPPSQRMSSAYMCYAAHVAASRRRAAPRPAHRAAPRALLPARNMRLARATSTLLHTGRPCSWPAGAAPPGPGRGGLGVRLGCEGGGVGGAPPGPGRGGCTGSGRGQSAARPAAAAPPPALRPGAPARGPARTPPRPPAPPERTLRAGARPLGAGAVHADLCRPGWRLRRWCTELGFQRVSCLGMERRRAGRVQVRSRAGALPGSKRGAAAPGWAPIGTCGGAGRESLCRGPSSMAQRKCACAHARACKADGAARCSSSGRASGGGGSRCLCHCRCLCRAGRAPRGRTQHV